MLILISRGSIIVAFAVVLSSFQSVLRPIFYIKLTVPSSLNISFNSTFKSFRSTAMIHAASEPSYHASSLSLSSSSRICLTTGP